MHACASGCPTKEASGGWPSLEGEGGSSWGQVGWRLRGGLGGGGTSPLRARPCDTTGGCGVYRTALGQRLTLGQAATAARNGPKIALSQRAAGRLDLRYADLAAAVADEPGGDRIDDLGVGQSVDDGDHSAEVDDLRGGRWSGHRRRCATRALYWRKLPL